MDTKSCNLCTHIKIDRFGIGACMLYKMPLIYFKTRSREGNPLLEEFDRCLQCYSYGRNLTEKDAKAMVKKYGREYMEERRILYNEIIRDGQ